MTSITYFNRRLAIDEIAKAYLASIGFFDINRENFSTCTEYTFFINNVMDKYKNFLNVVDRLAALTCDNDCFLICRKFGNFIMPGSPDRANKVQYEAFVYAFIYALEHDESALYFHFDPECNCVTQYSAKEMSEQLSKFKKYFD